MWLKRRYIGNTKYQHGSLTGAAVLLVNLGTPRAPTVHAVRHYLAEFLADPRVIEQPRWLWRLILHGVILRIRPRRSAMAYAKIWTSAGSPLLLHSQALADALEAQLKKLRGGPIQVRLAMRYGQPAIADVLTELMRENVRRVLVLPLYPQYSATSTGSVIDAVGAALSTLRWPPEIRFINQYFDEAAHVQALANSVENYWREHGRGERLLLSFHGIPESYHHAGDPYFCQCHATAQALSKRLLLDRSQYLVSFQSRVGRWRWLHPYTDIVLKELAEQGVRHVQVLCPGFAVDCLETLEEIAMQNRDLFLDAGGERYDYIPALNATAPQVDAMTELVLRHTQGWPEFDPNWSTNDDAARRAQAAARYAEVKQAHD